MQTSEPLEVRIGDMGWKVLTDSNNCPWFCRMEVVGMSSTGSSIHWMAIDAEDKRIHKGRHKARFSPEDAVKDYQKAHMQIVGYNFNYGVSYEVGDVLVRIREAEKLLDNIPSKYNS